MPRSQSLPKIVKLSKMIPRSSAVLDSLDFIVGFTEFDHELSSDIHNTFCEDYWIVRLCNHIMRAITMTADGIVWFAIPGVLFIVFGYKTLEYEWQSKLIIAAVLVAAIELCVKPIVGRQRPALPTNLHPRFIKAENFSFPSGHTMRAFFAASYISFRCSFNFLYGLSLFMWAFLVGFSRVATGRHFFFDCVAGAVFGVILDTVFATTGAIDSLYIALVSYARV